MEAKASLPSPAERRRIRRAGHVSAAQIAAVVGVSEAAVLHWERGIREPSNEFVVAYATALAMLEDMTTRMDGSE